MSGAPAFDRRVAVWLAAAGAVSLAVTLAFGLFSDVPVDVPSAGADSFSRSALGYSSLLDFLQASGVPVVVSRHRSAARARRGAPLLLLEPPAPAGGGEPPGEAEEPPLVHMVVEALGRGAPVVLVLPKWAGEPASPRREWVSRVEPLAPEEPSAVLAAVLREAVSAAAVRRLAAAEGGWSSALGGDASGLRPHLPYPQLLVPGEIAFEPLLWRAEGILAASLLDGRLTVIADPDLLNNAGLGGGDNPALAYHLLAGRLGAATLVVDETLHGFERPPALARELLDFPLLTLTLHLALLCALALWATVGRFGRPLPAPPRLPPGKRGLIDNTAALLAAGGHAGHTLERYFRLEVGEAARAVALGERGPFHRRLARLGDIARARGVKVDVEALGREIARLRAGGPPPTPGLALELARDLHRWRKEMSHGDR